MPFVYSSTVTTPLVTVATSLTQGGTVSLSSTVFEELILVGTATSGGVSLASAAFGSTTFMDGKKVTLIGNSDTNPVTLVADNTPISKGLWLNGNIVLGKGKSVTLAYNSTLDAYIEISRNA